VRVVDGDTIYVRIADRVEKVRYIGITLQRSATPRRARSQAGGRPSQSTDGWSPTGM
jgi:hypothetical protein